MIYYLKTVYGPKSVGTTLVLSADRSIRSYLEKVGALCEGSMRTELRSELYAKGALQLYAALQSSNSHHAINRLTATGGVLSLTRATSLFFSRYSQFMYVGVVL